MYKLFVKPSFLDNIYFIFYNFFYLFIYLWPRHAACGILVPWPGIKPVPPALEAQSLNHWTAREVPLSNIFIAVKYTDRCINLKFLSQWIFTNE